MQLFLAFTLLPFAVVMLIVFARPLIAFIHEYAAASFLYRACKSAGLTYTKKELLRLPTHAFVLFEIGQRSQGIAKEVLVLIQVIKIKLSKYHPKDVAEIYELTFDLSQQLEDRLRDCEEAVREWEDAQGKPRHFFIAYDDSAFPEFETYEEDGGQVIDSYLQELRALLRNMGGITHSLQSYRLVQPHYTKPSV